MSIKGIGAAQILPFDVVKTDTRKTRNTADRDPQQNLGQGSEELPKRHKFTDDEIQEIIAYLKELKGVKENNLQIRVERNGDRVVLFVEDIFGKVISRLPDTALMGLLNRPKDKIKGNLLNKSL